MESGTHERRRPVSCYVTPPLDSTTDFVRLDDAYTPRSDTFSYDGSPLASPVSSASDHTVSVAKPKPEQAGSPRQRQGLFRRLSSKLSRSSTKLAAPEPPSPKPVKRSFSMKSRRAKAAPSPKQESPAPAPQSPALMGSAPPLRPEPAAPPITVQSPPRSPHRPIVLQDPPSTTKTKYRHSVYGGTSFSTERVRTPASDQSPNYSFTSSRLDPVTDEDEPVTPTRASTRAWHLDAPASAKQPLRRLSMASHSVLSMPPTPTPESTSHYGLGIVAAPPGILKLKIAAAGEYMALRMRKDRLHSIHELTNLVMFKLVGTHPDWSLNDVRLLIVFRDSTLSPVVLKPTVREAARDPRPLYSDHDALLLDYIMSKDKIYITAQYTV